MTDQETLAKLRAENARLVALLDAHGVEWRLPAEPVVADTSEAEASRLSTNQKVALRVLLGVARMGLQPLFRTSGTARPPFQSWAQGNRPFSFRQSRYHGQICAALVPESLGSPDRTSNDLILTTCFYLYLFAIAGCRYRALQSIACLRLPSLRLELLRNCRQLADGRSTTPQKS